MDILDKHYPDKDHVLIFDNTTTHLKQEEDALSAMKMPKFAPKLGTNWGVTVSKFDKDCNSVHGTDGKVLKTQIRMVNAKFADGTIQSLYWPDSHKHVGVFKGMAAILKE
jgi:exonuclease III